MKRKLFACFLAWTMILSLAACGGSGNKAASSATTADAAPAETEGGYFDTNGSYDDASDSSGSVLEDQKIIYTGTLNLETTDFDSAAQALTTLADTLGGYLESSTVGNGGRSYRWAEYTVRVPADRFQSFLDQAGGLAHVTWQNTDLQNITETYYDTEGRLKTQQIKLERLQKLLAQAENMEDIITIESAISETEWNIENLSGTLRRYDSQVALSTITVNLQEVYKYSNTENVPESFGERIGSALTRGWSAFTDTVENILVALAYGWTWLVLLAVIGVTAAVCSRRALRRRQEKRKASAEKTDDKTGQV